jgi:hypothetical protein
VPAKPVQVFLSLIFCLLTFGYFLLWVLAVGCGSLLYVLLNLVEVAIPPIFCLLAFGYFLL